MTTRSSLAIPKAVKVPGLTYRSSPNGIHAWLHEPVKEWHPDVSEHDLDRSHVTVISIQEAHDILVAYGMNCAVSFWAEDIW